MTNQRARNLIAKDIKDMDMSMSMKDLSLEQAPVTSDMDMDDVDDRGSRFGRSVSTANSQSQLQQRPETSNAKRKRLNRLTPLLWRCNKSSSAKIRFGALNAIQQYQEFQDIEKEHTHALGVLFEHACRPNSVTCMLGMVLTACCAFRYEY